MLGIVYFMCFLVLGVAITQRILSQQPIYVRLWSGILVGIIGVMWGVVPFAFVFGFNKLSHILTLATMVLIYGFIRWRFPESGHFRILAKDVFQSLLWTTIPLFMLIVLMLNSHVLLPNSDGGLYGGQSTFGDLAMHLGFVTSQAELGVFPPEYAIFPGEKMNYPFLVDSLSSSLYLFGTSLRASILIPSYFLVLSLIMGFFIVSYEIVKSRFSAMLASVFFFINGGFGFIYFIEGAKKNPENFTRIFSDFYQTPTNYNVSNIRWSNVICDMIIPQRTTLAGWAFVLFAIWLVYNAIEKKNMRWFMMAGMMAGLMPMIHTHSFLALGILTITWSVIDIITSQNKKQAIINWGVFGLATMAIALPQLLFWTFPRSSAGGFLKWQSGWVNESDPWLWFWIKNVGVLFVLILPAFMTSNKKMMMLYSGAIALFVISDLVIFQPNWYDNNKLFYVWYMLTCILVADYLVKIYQQLNAKSGRHILMAIVIVLSVYSGLLTIGREWVSSYQIFNKDAVAAAEYIKTHTSKDALFLTANNHTNPVTALAGRRIFSGATIYLFFHGVDYNKRFESVINMYKQPEQMAKGTEGFSFDYVYFSSYEKDQFGVEVDGIKALYPQVFQQGDVYIFAISERARKENRVQ